MQRYPTIAIIGAGPGGLTFARILRRHGIIASIFERDASPSVRPQGGTLDLHPDTGQFALRCAGLDTEFHRIARYEDQESRLYDKYGALLFMHTDHAEGDRPEVDRTQLRQILLDSLPADAIRWGHVLSRIQPQSDGTYQLLFENGRFECFDLVVGADGAWSRTRLLVSAAVPIDTGVTFVEFGLDHVDDNHPEIAELVGHGLMFAIGDRKALIAQRNAHAHIRIYAALRTEDGWIATEDLEEPSAQTAKTRLTALFAGWSERLMRLIHVSGDPYATRPIYALPVGHHWESRLGITLLGDAAHLMSPFSGQGANLAMRDAADLALALVAETDWAAAVRSYERVMFPRSEEAAAGARDGLEESMSEHALLHTLDHMKERHG